jgi:peptidyl-prolyl cis-trans isomerase A (cyclophilin A)
MKTCLCTAFVILVLTPSPFALGQQATPQTPTPSSQTAPASSPSDLPDSPTAQVKTVIQPTGPTAVFDTSMGRITCRLFDKEAPVSVENFIALAEGTKDWKDPVSRLSMHNKRLYDGTIFHRVIPEFMVQGGDPMGTGMGDPGYYIKDEIDPNLNFDVAGRLAYANSGPGTDGSQFFITETPYDELDQRYTIFGQCDDSGVLTVKTIARVERDVRDKPLTPVVLNKVTIVPVGQALPPMPAPAAAHAPAAASNAPAAPAMAAPGSKPQ